MKVKDIWELIQLEEEATTALTDALKPLGINQVIESKEDLRSTLLELQSLASRGRTRLRRTTIWKRSSRSRSGSSR